MDTELAILHNLDNLDKRVKLLGQAIDILEKRLSNNEELINITNVKIDHTSDLLVSTAEMTVSTRKALDDLVSTLKS